jgi:hypothetical protein
MTCWRATADHMRAFTARVKFGLGDGKYLIW